MSASASAHGHEEKKPGLNGLAVIGFIALVIAGMLLAVYASRYVPDLVSRLSSAVYLSTDRGGNDDDNGGVIVAPGGDEPAPSDEDENEAPPVVIVTPPAPAPEPEAPAATTTTPVPPAPSPAPSPAPAPAPALTYVAPAPAPVAPEYYGLPDLALASVRVGYFRGSTFIEDDEVQDGRDMGLQFTVVNRGTNIASGWEVRVKVEGERDAIGAGGTLYPEGTQRFTLRVTNPEEGRDLTTRIEVDADDDLRESDERNNDRSIDVDIEEDN